MVETADAATTVIEPDVVTPESGETGRVRRRRRKKDPKAAAIEHRVSIVVTAIRAPFGVLATLVLIVCFVPETLYLGLYVGAKFSFLLLVAERGRIARAWRRDRLIRAYPATVKAIEAVWQWVAKR
ncbi:MAG: hypothetical protein AAGJ97_01025 [Planctomycetota bacterium]